MSELQRIRQQSASLAHRHLLVIETEIDVDIQRVVRPVVEQVFPGSVAVAGKLNDDSADRADQVSRHLGTECPAALFDAIRPFDPGLLAAVASTVTAGGLMAVITPPFDLWPLTFSVHQRSRFIDRFIALFQTARVNADAMMSHRLLSLTGDASPTSEGNPVPAPVRMSSVEASTIAASEQSNGPWRKEQEQLLQTLFEGVENRCCHVFIIEAERGRGKSSLLGRLAAMLDAADRQWQLTSPRRSAVDSFERHWHMDANHCSATKPLNWIPTDQVNAKPDTVLFVDEAADVPLPQLLAWADQRPMLILATTTHGYEGSGRGFGTRFHSLLSGTGKTWQRFTLKHPIRYGCDDPLETLLNQVLLLDANAIGGQIDPEDLEIRHCEVHHLSQDALLDDENRLRAVFGLLREAHYQTTPMDLVNLLDADRLSVYVLTRSDKVLAVALVAQEGGIERSLHEPIMSGKRRLKDQLLPQLLARMSNQPVALEGDYLRIVRIAVAPEARRIGLGSHLLHQIESQLDTGIEAIGASYSQDPQTASFWQHCGFETFHQGFRAHPRSGHTTAAVLRILDATDPPDARPRPSSAALEQALASAREVLEANRLAATNQTPGPMDTELLKRFSQGARTYHDTRGALLHLWTLDPTRRAKASLETLEEAICASLPAEPSRKRREAALRAWAGKSLARHVD